MISEYRFSKHLKVDRESYTIYVQTPEANMQTDSACFEAAAMLLRCERSEAQIQLSFHPVNWTGSFESLTADQQHYMRFLYRLCRFLKEQNWCALDDVGQKELRRFTDAISAVKPINNVPNIAATFNTSKGKEHILENLFFKDNGRYLSDLLEGAGENRLVYIDHQLPNGLFANSVSEDNRIFPTGFFDLWGVNTNNELCIFELKTPENRKMGMISELFFYAEYALNYLLDPTTVNPSKATTRGYDRILEMTRSGCKKVNAYFLTGATIHPQIEKNKEDFCQLLNSNPQIHYQFLQYDPENTALQLRNS